VNSAASGGPRPPQHFKHKKRCWRIAASRKDYRAGVTQKPVKRIRCCLYGVRAIADRGSRQNSYQTPGPSAQTSARRLVSISIPITGRKAGSSTKRSPCCTKRFQATSSKAACRSTHRIPDIRRFLRKTARTGGWACCMWSRELSGVLYRDPYSDSADVDANDFAAVRCLRNGKSINWLAAEANAIDYFISTDRASLASGPVHFLAAQELALQDGAYAYKHSPATVSTGLRTSNTTAKSFDSRISRCGVRCRNADRCPHSIARRTGTGPYHSQKRDSKADSMSPSRAYMRSHPVPSHC